MAEKRKPAARKPLPQETGWIGLPAIPKPGPEEFALTLLRSPESLAIVLAKLSHTSYSPEHLARDVAAFCRTLAQDLAKG